MASVTISELLLSGVIVPAQSQAASSGSSASTVLGQLLDDASGPPRAVGSSAVIRDLKLDSHTLDIAVEDGDVVIIEDADVVAQHLRLRLSTQLREWFLDQDSGVDYLEGVAPKGAAREALLRDKISSVPHVQGLTAFEATLDAGTRVFRVDFTVRTDFGEVTQVVEVP